MLEFLGSWRRPSIVTLFLDLDPSCERSKVAKAIGEFEDQLKVSTHRVMERIHFLRIFIVPGSPESNDRLAFSVVFDGEKIGFLTQLVAGLRSALIPVVKNAVEFDQMSSQASDMDLAQWILSHNRKPAAYHVGSVWNSQKQIKDDHEIFLMISEFLDQQSGLNQQKPQEIKRLVEQSLKRRLPDIQTRIKRNRRQIIFDESLRGGDATLFLLAIFLIPAVPAILIVLTMGWAWVNLFWLIPVLAVVILLAIAAFVRHVEKGEEDVEIWPEDDNVSDVVSGENVQGQNQMTLVVDVKDSLARRIILPAVLWVADAVSRHLYRRGKLAGIDTIHFARFFLLDGGTKMVFMSDYDGSWSRYLFDFTGPGSLAVVPIWSSLIGCPKARFLRYPEVGFEERFLPFTRGCQLKTQCWFSNYPRLSVSEIKRNEKIRAGLFKSSTDQKVLDWLALFNGGANV
jgi:hypothetical protein